MPTFRRFDVSTFTMLLRHRQVDPAATPLVMGVLNVTPDSFSDGGDHFAGISSLLRHPKEIFEGLEREFDAAHQVIQAEKVERRQVSVC